jgi:Ca-activated chloride channel family protein
MSFVWPVALVGLVVVPLAVLGYWLMQRRRRRIAARFGTPALLPNLVAASPGWRRHLPPAVLLVALAALLVGVARPQAMVTVPREDATVVLAIDVSDSMMAKDVHPTRLAAAQKAARTFLAKLPKRYRVGIVAFATRANVVAPATDRRDIALAALGALRSGTGTALGEAIERSLAVARQAVGIRQNEIPASDRSPVAVLLLSDGAQTQPGTTPLQGADDARKLHVPVFTVALGTAAGVVNRKLPGGFTERIQVPPDPQTLAQIAKRTGGEAFTAPDQEKLQKVYKNLASRLGHKREKRELTDAFAGGAALLMLVGGGLSALWFGRIP